MHSFMSINTLYNYSTNSHNSPGLGEHNAIADDAKIIECRVSTEVELIYAQIAKCHKSIFGFLMKLY